MMNAHVLKVINVMSLSRRKLSMHEFVMPEILEVTLLTEEVNPILITDLGVVLVCDCVLVLKSGEGDGHAA